MAADAVLGERNTRQKQAIREVFLRAERPLSVDEVLAEASASGDSVSLPTVYRTIRALVIDGWLATVELPGRTPVYETNKREHHHHFVCERCARVFELYGCSSVDVRVPEGFVTNSHDIVLLGLCKECSHRDKSRRKKR
jgi:Fur family ferric uptake transcriptional regulator